MNSTLTKVLQILFALFCIGFGIDKFIPFLPTCSLTNHISSNGMIATGIVEIALGISLLLNKYVLICLRLATGIMIFGLIFHLATSTYDCGGAFIGTILGLILIYAHKNINQ